MIDDSADNPGRPTGEYQKSGRPSEVLLFTGVIILVFDLEPFLKTAYIDSCTIPVTR